MQKGMAEADEVREAAEAFERQGGGLSDPQFREDLDLGNQDDVDIGFAAADLDDAVIDVLFALGDVGEGLINNKLRAHLMRNTPYDTVIPTEPEVESARLDLLEEIEERVRACIRQRAN